MRRFGFAILAVTFAPMHAGGAQVSAVPISVTISTRGLASPDSSLVIGAIRSGLEADSMFHIVYRPSPMTASNVVGEWFEVARLKVSANVTTIGGRDVVELSAIDVVSTRRLESRAVDVPPDRPLDVAVREAAREFAQQLSKQVK